MAQLVEHIVHIDGVTGSSPVATTREALESQGSRAFISAQCFKSCQKAAVGGLSLSKKSACGGLFRQNTFPLLANIEVLRAGRAQPLYLLMPAGRFALRATAHRADASLRRLRRGRGNVQGNLAAQGSDR